MPPGGVYPPPVYPGVVYVQQQPDPGKGMAITGFILGIVSICMLCLTTYGAVATIVVAILGVVFSALGRKSRTCHGLAITGLVLSIIGGAVSLLFVLMLIGLVASLFAGGSLLSQ